MKYLFILIAYLSGSVPYGLILTKIFGGVDVRKIGSGNRHGIGSKVAGYLDCTIAVRSEECSNNMNGTLIRARNPSPARAADAGDIRGIEVPEYR